jgi:hypothetical protein
MHLVPPATAAAQITNQIMNSAHNIITYQNHILEPHVRAQKKRISGLIQGYIVSIQKLNTIDVFFRIPKYHWYLGLMISSSVFFQKKKKSIPKPHNMHPLSIGFVDFDDSTQNIT